MQHARRLSRSRLVAAAALTLCAGLTLTGCRSQPDVAAYVGDDVLTEARIDALIADFNAKNQNPDRPAPTRTDIVSTFVFNEVCADMQAEQNFASAPVTADDVAQSESVPADSDYAKERVRFRSCVGGIKPSTEPATEAELRDVYDRAVAGGLVAEDQTFDSIKAAIEADQSVSSGLAYLHAIDSFVANGNITVNPRYRPLEIVTGSIQTENGAYVPVVVVTLGEPGLDAVVNAPPTTPAAAPAG